MDIKDIASRYAGARLNDRSVNQLLGLAQGIIADGKVDQSEAEFLYKWMISERTAVNNPLIAPLFVRIHEMLSDDVLDADESQELLQTLQALTGSDYEVGEAAKATTLPLCEPAPEISFDGSRFCFTGTFAFGSKRECENKVKEFGATAGGIAKSTDFLVIGIYATDSWIQSSFGRKIEKAVMFRSSGVPISIISEEHWLSYID